MKALTQSILRTDAETLADKLYELMQGTHHHNGVDEAERVLVADFFEAQVLDALRQRVNKASSDNARNTREACGGA
jgi:hypothetical protein